MKTWLFVLFVLLLYVPTNATLQELSRKDHLGVSKRCNSIHPFLLNPPSQSTLSYSIHHLNPPFYFKLLNPLISPQLNPPNSIHPFLLNPVSQSTLSCSIHHLNPFLNLTPKWSFLELSNINEQVTLSELEHLGTNLNNAKFKLHLQIMVIKYLNLFFEDDLLRLRIFSSLYSEYIAFQKSHKISDYGYPIRCLRTDENWYTTVQRQHLQNIPSDRWWTEFSKQFNIQLNDSRWLNFAEILKTSNLLMSKPRYYCILSRGELKYEPGIYDIQRNMMIFSQIPDKPIFHQPTRIHFITCEQQYTFSNQCLITVSEYKFWDTYTVGCQYIVEENHKLKFMITLSSKEYRTFAICYPDNTATVEYYNQTNLYQSYQFSILVWSIDNQSYIATSDDLSTKLIIEY